MHEPVSSHDFKFLPSHQIDVYVTPAAYNIQVANNDVKSFTSRVAAVCFLADVACNGSPLYILFICLKLPPLAATPTKVSYQCHFFEDSMTKLLPRVLHQTK